MNCLYYSILTSTQIKNIYSKSRVGWDVLKSLCNIDGLYNTAISQHTDLLQSKVLEFNWIYR